MVKVFGQVYGVVREVFLAVDAGNAVRHGVPVSENAQRHCAPRYSR